MWNLSEELSEREKFKTQLGLVLVLQKRQKGKSVIFPHVNYFSLCLFPVLVEKSCAYGLMFKSRLVQFRPHKNIKIRQVCVYSMCTMEKDLLLLRTWIRICFEVMQNKNHFYQVMPFRIIHTSLASICFRLCLLKSGNCWPGIKHFPFLFLQLC